MLPIFTPVGSASANDTGYKNLESTKFEEVVNMLEFMYEGTTIKDESNDIVNLDFDKFKEKHRDSEDLAENEKNIWFK